MSLIEKLRKNTTIKESAVLDKSKFFNAKDMITTPVPMFNVAFSAKLDGGITPGLTLLAGPSKHFKTAFALLLAKSYMDKYDDAIILFYDSEFGSPGSYFKSFGIDPTRVFHSPLENLEQLKFDIMKQLQDIGRGEHVFILVDSVGNLASKKEVEDALKENSAADMSRAKQFKSLFRMVTPHLNLKDIPMVAVAHTYQTQEMYSKTVVSGGTGQYYSADNIFIIGRQQEKDGTELTGYKFVINIEKSRYVREKSKIEIDVSFEGGINKWSGLLENGLESGFVIKPKLGWYAKVDKSTGEIVGKNYRESETNEEEFWKDILANKEFQEFITTKYQISSGSIMQYDEAPVEAE